MTAPALSDAAAREKVRTSLDATLFVDAGAGTGKTTALVARVVELVRRGESLAGLAAITFTEAAAAELRDRLRSALDREEAAGTVPAGTVAELDEAAITTLHGFAQRLLAAAPLAAGLPPRFEVFDETQARLAFAERWARFCDEAEAAPAAAAVLERALAAGVTYSKLQAVARRLHEARHRLPPPPADEGPLPKVAVAGAAAALRAAAAHLPHATDGADKLCALLAGSPGNPGFAEMAAELEEAPGDVERLEALAAIADRSLKAKGSKTKWRIDVEEVRAARNDALAQVNAALAQAGEALVAPLTGLLVRFVSTYAAERLRQGTLEFHDLLVAARDLLRANTAVRHLLAQRYPRLLVDEFQDTDPLQIEIVTLLTTSAAEVGAVPWQELPTASGRAFFVGDQKQSIYRFRHADLALFDTTRLVHSDEIVELHDNFRSVPGILSWVNAVFAALFTSAEPDGQATPQALTAARPALPGSGPPVRLLGGPLADTRMAELRTAEAADVAAVLRDAHATGWPVASDGPGGARGAPTRPIRWADMAVLLPTRLSLAHLEAALGAAEVPYRVDSASLVWQSSPVRELLLVLRALADPSDAVALVGALRSPLLGCSDEALLQYRQAGGRWEDWPRPHQQVEACLAADHPVLVALGALRRLHTEAATAPVGAVVDTAARQLGAYELATAQQRPRDHWRRLRFLVEEARAFSSDTGGTLAAFCTWAAVQSEQEVRAREPVLPEDDDDAVRVLTVHGAKGQEFPLCVLAGLHTRPRAPRPAVLWGSEDQPLPSFSAAVTAEAYAGACEAEARYADQERVRLLYVAATRARDHLVVCLHRLAADDEKLVEDPEKVSLAALVARAVDAAGLDTTPALVAADGEPASPAAAVPVAAAASSAEGAAWSAAEVAWQQQRAELLATGCRQPVLAATTLAARLHQGLSVAPSTLTTAALGGPGAATVLASGPALLTDGPAPTGPATPGEGATDADPEAAVGEHSGVDEAEAPPVSPEPDPDAPAGRRGRAGTAIGRAVHATLQLADLADPASVPPLAEAQAAAEGVPGRARQVTALAQAALGSDVVRAAVAARHWRELYLAAPVGPTLLEGFVDLLYEGPDGLVVVDYKTDAVRSAAAVRAAVARYRLQLAAYALLVQTTTARPVGGAALVFLVGGKAHSEWIEALPEAIAEVQEALHPNN